MTTTTKKNKQDKPNSLQTHPALGKKELRKEKKSSLPHSIKDPTLENKQNKNKAASYPSVKG